MIVVKITILLIIITVIFRMLVYSYLASNLDKALKIKLNKNYAPWYIWCAGILTILSAIGIIASAIWILFMR